MFCLCVPRAVRWISDELWLRVFLCVDRAVLLWLHSHARQTIFNAAVWRRNTYIYIYRFSHESWAFKFDRDSFLFRIISPYARPKQEQCALIPTDSHHADEQSVQSNEGSVHLDAWWIDVRITIVCTHCVLPSWHRIIYIYIYGLQCYCIWIGWTNRYTWDN